MRTILWAIFLKKSAGTVVWLHSELQLPAENSQSSTPFPLDILIQTEGYNEPAAADDLGS